MVGVGLGKDMVGCVSLCRIKYVLWSSVGYFCWSLMLDIYGRSCKWGLLIFIFTFVLA